MFKTPNLFELMRWHHTTKAKMDWLGMQLIQKHGSILIRVTKIVEN
jgi:hypothetical protein